MFYTKTGKKHSIARALALFLLKRLLDVAIFIIVNPSSRFYNHWFDAVTPGN
jgi:hypothetical protein